MSNLHLKLVTPEKVIFEEDFESITLDTSTGQVTILPNHAPLVSQLVPGELMARKKGEERYLHLSGGFLTVEPDSKVVILADAAEHIFEIDEARAKVAMERARKALSEERLSAEEIAETEAALGRSLARLNIVRRRAMKHGRKRGEHPETIQ